MKSELQLVMSAMGGRGERYIFPHALTGVGNPMLGTATIVLICCSWGHDSFPEFKVIIPAL